MKKYSVYIASFSILLNLSIGGLAYHYYKGFKEYKTLAEYKSERFDKLASNFNSVRDRNLELNDKLEGLSEKKETLEKNNKYLNSSNRKLQNKVSNLTAINNRYSKIRAAGKNNKKVRTKYRTKRKNCNSKVSKKKYSNRKKSSTVSKRKNTKTVRYSGSYNSPRNYNRR